MIGIGIGLVLGFIGITATGILYQAYGKKDLSTLWVTLLSITILLFGMGSIVSYDIKVVPITIDTVVSSEWARYNYKIFTNRGIFDVIGYEWKNVDRIECVKKTAWTGISYETLRLKQD